MTVQKLAESYGEWFTGATRADGTSYREVLDLVLSRLNEIADGSEDDDAEEEAA